MAGHDGFHRSDDGGDLGRRGTGEGRRVGDQGVEVGPGQPEPGVRGEPVEQVVVRRPCSRIASATATACSLIASCACSRPTPARTAAIRTFVVARNGR